jgi:hypothetical protein
MVISKLMRETHNFFFIKKLLCLNNKNELRQCLALLSHRHGLLPFSVIYKIRSRQVHLLLHFPNGVFYLISGGNQTYFIPGFN